MLNQRYGLIAGIVLIFFAVAAVTVSCADGGCSFSDTNNQAALAEGDDQSTNWWNWWTNKLPVGVAGGVWKDGTAHGWAYDPDTPNRKIDVHLYLDGPIGEGTFLASVRANKTKEEVDIAHRSYGRWYSYTIPEQYLDGTEHTIYVYGVDSRGGGDIAGSLALLRKNPTTFTLGDDGINELPVGYAGNVWAGQAHGWAYDPDQPGRKLNVNLYMDGRRRNGTFLGSVRANQHRADIDDAHVSQGHWYEFPVPIEYWDGQPHQIYAYGIDADTDREELLRTNPTDFQSVNACSDHPAGGICNYDPRCEWVSGSCRDTDFIGSNNAPVIESLGGTSELTVGEEGRWRLTAQDPDNDRLFYSVDWGDGTTEERRRFNDATELTHTYSTEGNQSIRVTVTDVEGASDVATRQATVSEEEETYSLTDPRVFDCNYLKDKYYHLSELTCEQIQSKWTAALRNNEIYDAHPLFNVEQYYRLYIEPAGVPRNYRQLVISYLRNGIDAGRVGKFALAPKFFNCGVYSNNYNHLQSKSCHELKHHWLNHGMQQGLTASNQFNIRDYLNDNPLLKERFKDNYDLAWRYYLYFEVDNYQNFTVSEPYALIPFDFCDHVNCRYTDTVRVDDYVSATAVRNGRDVSAEVKRAINRAVELSSNPNKRVELRFGAGPYRINANEEDKFFAEIKEVSDLTISGSSNGTEIIIRDYDKGFLSFENATNTAIRNLTLDYDTAPYIEGEVLAVFDANSDGALDSVRLQHNTEYDQMPLSHIADDSIIAPGDKFGYVLEGNTSYRKKGTGHFFRSDIHLQNNGVILLNNFYQPGHFVGNLKYIKVGDSIVYTQRVRGSGAFKTRGGANIVFDSVTVRTAPAVAFMILENKGTSFFNNVHIAKETGSKRALTNSAGGVIIHNGRGKVTLQNSYFEANADDAANWGTQGGVAFGVPGDTYIAAADGTEATLAANQILINARGQVYKINDRLQLVDPTDGTFIQKATITGVGDVYRLNHVDRLRLSKNDLVLTLNAEIDSKVTGGENLQGRDDFLSPFPNTIVFNKNNAMSGSVAQNNIFGPLRGRGVLMKTPGGKILDNDFMGIDERAIRSLAEFRENPHGPLPEDLLIRNNTFEGGTMDSGSHISLGVHPYPFDRRDVSQRAYNANTRIINNRFVDTRAENIKLFGASNVEIRNNVFEGLNLDEFVGVNDNARYILPNNNNVNYQASDNTFIDRRPIGFTE